MAASSTNGKHCPWCGGEVLEKIQRGYAGKTDTNDQYYRCHSCGKTIWEIVSVTGQELRLGRYTVGKPYTERGDRYLIRRILKVGFNEYLVYLKPAPLAAPAESAPAENR